MEEEERDVWEGKPSQIQNLPTFVACGLFVWLVIPAFVALQRFLEVHYTHYRLTSECFEVKTGLLSRRIEQLELYRVKDLSVEEPLLMRAFGLGNLIVHSSDRSHPTLVLRGVKDCVALRDQVRGLVEKRRDAKRVHELDV